MLSGTFLAFVLACRSLEDPGLIQVKRGAEGGED